MHWDVRRFEQRLLSLTLRHCLSNIPYYQRLRDSLPENPQLSDLPILRKAQLSENPEDFWALDRFPDYLLLTGGSMGIPSLTFRNLDEQQLILKNEIGLRKNDIVDPDTLSGFVINIGDEHHHGFVVAGSYGQPVVSLPLTRRSHAELIRRFLEQGIVIDGRKLPVTGIMAGTSKLKMLTAYLYTTDFDSKNCMLQGLFAYGFHVSKIWRERLNSFWGTQVYPMFGTTETNASVPIICSYCGGYHHKATVLCEYLDPFTEVPVEEGCSVLTITTLYPFYKLSPRLRYWTGDVVELLNPCTAAAEGRGFRFRGREKSSVMLRKGNGGCQVFLSNLDVVETLDGMEEVATYDPLRDGFTRLDAGEKFSPPFNTGNPYFSMTVVGNESGAPRVQITVEAKGSPDGALLEELRERIRFGLAEIAEPFFRLGLPLELEVIPEGGLRERGERILLT